MKKDYIAPTLVEVKIETTTMIATSTFERHDDSATVDVGGVNSNGKGDWAARDGWFDEDEE